MKKLNESILCELNRQDIMSDQNVIDIINSFSSRKNHLKYKIEGNQAEFEDGTIIKFIVNDDSDIEYYFINSQGDASKAALVYDWSLLDTLTESETYGDPENDLNHDAGYLFDYDRVKEHLDNLKSILVYNSDQYVAEVSNLDKGGSCKITVDYYMLVELCKMYEERLKELSKEV